MKWVHLLGLGLVVGMAAIGAMLAAVGLRWQEANYPDQVAIGARPVEPPPSAAGPATAEEVARGQAIFQQRCANCHSIGGGRRVGPDLAGVTDRRAHDWLVEFIANPELVHARNDPIALELQREYGMQMPNVGVTKAQAEDVLVYIRAESAGGLGQIQVAPGAAATPGTPAAVGSPTPEVPVSPPAGIPAPAPTGGATLAPTAQVPSP